ncbi:hypothetical protein B0H14DRAFT_2612098 [Mycena olivaceomarginata]|nr:hypothetical protein B0H14DRAFT_2612098 [Mycena olivaceomarginata]
MLLLSKQVTVLPSGPEPTLPPPAKGKGKGKAVTKKSNKQTLNPGAEENPTKKPHKPNSKVVVTNKEDVSVPTLLPHHEREALPVDDSGHFYVLSYNIITTAVGDSAPMDGPRCTDCQLTGTVCGSRGCGLPCECCNTSYTISACEFTSSDEILNDLGLERVLWFNMSAPNLEVATENYALTQRARDNAEKEMHFKTLALALLHRIPISLVPRLTTRRLV